MRFYNIDANIVVVLSRVRKVKELYAHNAKARITVTLNSNMTEEASEMAKGRPKRDGSGKGRRGNKGRGGCKSTRKTGRGRSR